MRLTLRTLLAHLDKTLEADDDAAIAAKLRESDFASHLVQRIHASMESNQIGAPSPVSTSTADDPNRIGEYLDSVLSAEQVAEIERICLESDAHLAEVAACHQILTIVLGNPAEIPPTLRARIYDLGQHSPGPGFAYPSPNGSASGATQRSAALLGANASDGAISQALASSTMAATNLAGRGSSVLPVGLDDSGVSDAPTRLRSAGAMHSKLDDVTPVFPGTRRIRASEMSDFAGRPSRVVPWLVSLALVASFLFVAVQAFSPLLRKRAAAVDDDKIVTMNTSPAESTDADSVRPQTKTEEAAATEDQPIILPEDEIRQKVLEAELNEAPPLVEADPATMKTEPSPAPAMNAIPPVPSIEEKPAAPVAMPDADNVADEKAPEMKEVMPTETPAMEPVDAAEVKEVIPSSSMLVSDGSLFLMRKPADNTYVLAKKEELIPNGSEVVCPPLYRDRLSLAEQFELTMIGPAKLVIDQPSRESVELTPSLGRFLLSAFPDKAPIPTDEDAPIEPTLPVDKRVTILFGDLEHEVILNGADTIAAIEISHSRPPGADPENGGSSTQSIHILAVQGSLQWKVEDAGEFAIETGEFATWSPAGEVAKMPVGEVPTWLEQPKALTGSIESSARDGLLALVRGNESIELSLREAIAFRRSEVGALAAQTLALLDRPAVYFGADGIFSDLKQKPHWESHFATLVATVDRGPESAAIVREAIDQMDAAESSAIYRMLWLFSNPQLEAGSDELLVSSLDNANMTVRVLAAENLRRITGTTQFFKPENETAPRRASDIKKWETRLRKGDIRWPEAAAEAATE